MRGYRELTARLQDMSYSCEKAADRAAEEAARFTWQMARGIVPVRTGHLRSTLRKYTKDKAHTVGTACHYAFYVEGGTRRMQAQPYLRPSFMASDFRARLIRALREAIH